MSHQQTEEPEGCVNPSASVIPVSISEKPILVNEICLPGPQPRRTAKQVEKGQWTLFMAAIALLVVAICLLFTFFLMAEPYQLSTNYSLIRKPNIPMKNIYIIDINEDNFPSSQKLKTLEECLIQNKDNEIYQITINKYIDQYNNYKALYKLKKKYVNFHFLFQNAPSYFKGSIFDGTTDNDNPSQLILKAQLVILWRYSGTVLSSNWVPLKAIEKAVYTRDDKTFKVGSFNGHIGFIFSPNTCNAKLFDIMTQIKKCNISENLAMDVVDCSMLNLKSGIEKVSFPQLCNNNTINEQCFLMKNNWSERSSNQTVDVEKTSADTIISKDTLAPRNPNGFSQSNIPTIFRRIFIYT